QHRAHLPFPDAGAGPGLRRPGPGGAAGLMALEGTQVTAAEGRRPWQTAAVVFAATAACFLPSLRNGFVGAADHSGVLGADHTYGLDGDFQPLGWAILEGQRRLWGSSAWGYHLVSILL